MGGDIIILIEVINMKNKGIFFEVDMEMLPFPVLISIGQEPMEIIKSLNLGPNVDCSSLIETLNDTNLSLAQTINLNSGANLIYIYDMPKTFDDIISIIHESIHATHYLFDSVGISITMGNSEIVAYTVTYIVSQIFHKFQDIELVLKKSKVIKKVKVTKKIKKVKVKKS